MFVVYRVSLLFLNTILFLLTIRITPTIMTIVATIILRSIFSSSIIHPKKTAITGLTYAKVLAKVAVVFLRIQKNPSHPIVPTIIRYKRESIDEEENLDTSTVLNSIIIPMPSKNNPPTNNIIPVEINILFGKSALCEYNEPIAQLIAAINKIDIPRKLFLLLVLAEELV